MLSSDGACKSFDVSANGHCCSESAVAMCLKKRIERSILMLLTQKQLKWTQETR